MNHGLFVYGTLAPGQRNAHVLSPLNGQWTEAKVRGRLKQLGWGSEFGYPGIVLDDTADWVSGHLFTSKELESHWQRLDDFEGPEYQRILIPVYLCHDTVAYAYIYALRQES